jgi:hypothetical protein
MEQEKKGSNDATSHGPLHPALRHECSKRERGSVTGPIRVPPPAVTFRIRLLSKSATKMLPLASTSRPIGVEKPALVPDPSAKAELVPLTPPANVVTTVQSTTTHIINKNNTTTHHHLRITPYRLKQNNSQCNQRRNHQSVNTAHHSDSVEHINAFRDNAST